MKKIVSLAIVLLALGAGVSAQNYNADANKAQKKETREAIKEKASKEAKKSAKQMAKKAGSRFPAQRPWKSRCKIPCWQVTSVPTACLPTSWDRVLQ